MTISGSTPTTLLDSVLDANATREEISLAVLKKAKDVTEQQGQAMVQLMEQAGAPNSSGRLDVYA